MPLDTTNPDSVRELAESVADCSTADIYAALCDAIKAERTRCRILCIKFRESCPVTEEYARDRHAAVCIWGLIDDSPSPKETP